MGGFLPNCDLFTFGGFIRKTMLNCESDVCMQDDSLIPSKMSCKDCGKQVCCRLNEPTSSCLVQVGQMKPYQSGRLGVIG